MWFIRLIIGIMLNLHSVILAIIGSIFLIIYLIQRSGKNSKSYNGQRWRCAHGYTACVPNCPLYKHCWGDKKDKDEDMDLCQALISPPSFISQTPSESEDNSWVTSWANEEQRISYYDDAFQEFQPSFASEDGDWRTVWQDDQRYDDQRYDDRYEDERNDSDRYNNGGW